MAKHTKAVKTNIPMCIAAVLFCLTLISIHLTSGLYAKYISTAFGQDSARVIKFGDLTLAEEGDFYEENKLMIIPGVDLTKKVTVSFSGSEAATYVFAELVLSSWKTDDNENFAVFLNGKPAMQWCVAEGWRFLKSDNGTYTYYRELAPNTALDKVNVIADDGRIAVDETITRSEIASLAGISLNIRAGVVQSNGFENADAAYHSITEKGRSANR